MREYSSTVSECVTLGKSFYSYIPLFLLIQDNNFLMRSFLFSPPFPHFGVPNLYRVKSILSYFMCVVVFFFKSVFAVLVVVINV